MSLVIDNLPEAIRTTKQQLRASLPGYKEVFHEVEAETRRRVEEIVDERAAGRDVVPIAQYADIEAEKVAPELVAKIKARGACVVRNTSSPEQANTWDDEIAAYVEPGRETRERGRGQILRNAGFGEAADLRNLLVAPPGGSAAVAVADERADFPEQSVAIGE